MAILKLKPALKHYLWGGKKLIESYGINSDQKVAEAWVVSCHPDGPSKIESGPFENMTLTEYIEKQGNDILGTHGKSYESFPILVKLLDANLDLSIQVHPNDEYALEVEGEYGKNEMWLILESEPGSIIYYGVNQDLTKEEFKASIENQTILEKLRKVETKPYDFFYMPTGTIHALGKGNVIVEVQQSSNSTYRIYDFDRRDSEGNLRELHIDKAVAVSTLSPMAYEPIEIKEEVTPLIHNQYFKTQLIKLNKLTSFEATELSFQALVVLKGEGLIRDQDQEYKLKPGDGFFVEANSQYEIDGNLELLIAEV